MGNCESCILSAALSDTEANRDAWKTNAGGWQSRALAAEAKLREAEQERDAAIADCVTAEHNARAALDRAEAAEASVRGLIEASVEREANLRECREALREIRDEIGSLSEMRQRAQTALTRSNENNETL